MPLNVSQLVFAVNFPHCSGSEVRQWGICVNGNNTFPVSFSEFFVLTIGGEHPYSGGSFMPEKPSSLNGFNYKLTINNYYGGYIAVGK